MLSVKKIYKAYPIGKKTFFALRKTSFSLPKQGMVGISGKSGSGKTTLLNLLSGLDTPSGGKVYFQGKLLEGKAKENYLGKEVALVFQHYNLIDGASVFENVALPYRISGKKRINLRKKVNELLSEVGLNGFENRNVDTLSGGEKQRVALCRALINDPSVIFADEPTGALDQKSAKAVMDILSRVSKTRLVVFVSHNPSFIKEYADIKIEVNDGRVAVSNSIKEQPMPEKRKFANHEGWSNLFTKRNLKRNVAKNLLCFFAGVVGFAAMGLTIGFFQGSQASLEQQQSRILGYQVAYLSEEEKIELPNSPLTLVKRKRPLLESAQDVLEGLDSVAFEYDLSYFLPSSISYSLDGKKQDPVRFFPFFDLSLDTPLLKDGSPAKPKSFGQVIVNTKFASLYPESILGSQIEINCEIELTRSEKHQSLVLEYGFEICGVVDELTFMGEPRVYYSHPGLLDYLSGVEVESFGTGCSILDFLSEEKPDSPYLRYQYLIFIKEKEEVKALFKRKRELDGSSFKIESEAETIASSFSSLMEAFQASLIPVVGISLAGLGAILAMMAYSSFVSRKKEAAILMSLGARRASIASIFGKEAGLICFASCLGGLLLTIPLEKLANLYLENQFGFSSIVAIPWNNFLGLPFLIPLGFPLAALILGFSLGAIPVGLSSNIPLAKELRDE